MDRFKISDGAIEYQVRGSGEPLLMIHGALIADAFEAMAPVLASSYRLITYRRRGFGGSSPIREAETMANQAGDAVAVLDHLDVRSAHVAGHSYGGAIALQIAADHPTRVHSLGLLEPGLLAAPSGAAFGAGVAPIADLYGSGDTEGTLVSFLTAVGGDDPVPRISKTLASGWYEQALVDLPALFGADLPSLGAWDFNEQQARSIHQPALTVKGSNTFPLCAETYDLLNAWLPNAESFVLDGATHLLQMDDPEGMTKGLVAFLGKHPMAA
jgi:pimeloyl-ACP methyl ester carboxylesterase